MLQNDGKFVKVLNRIADLVGLNLLAILFCIPIVTIGASITAVYGFLLTRFQWNLTLRIL